MNPCDLAAEQEREEDDERVEAQRAAEDLRRDDVPLELLQRQEAEPDPDRGQRVVERRDHDRRDRPEDGPDVGDELHEAEPRPERERVAAAVLEDPERRRRPT